MKVCSSCGGTHNKRGALCSSCYYLINRDRVRQRTAAYKQAHKDQVNAGNRAWRARNPEKAKAYRKAWNVKYPEKVKAIQRRKYVANPPDKLKARARVRAWAEANPEKVRANRRLSQQRRRARKRQLSSTLTAGQWAAIKAIYGNKCAYCGLKTRKLTQDHVIPVSRGGAYTAANIVPACGKCNSAKGTGDPPVRTLRLLLV